MFGYVIPQKQELKIREFAEYKSVYCGICSQLNTGYSPQSRLLLSYDAVFVALLVDALQGNSYNKTPLRCISNPFIKRAVASCTNGISYAAAANVALSYIKLLDNTDDEDLLKKAASFFARGAMHGSYIKVTQSFAFCEALKDAYTKQKEIEKNGESDVDIASEQSGNMLGAVLRNCNGENCGILHNIGMYLGKLVYVLDAADDFERDQKKGGYNVFLLQSLSKEVMITQAKTLASGYLNEIWRNFNMLQLKTNSELLCNIVFGGLPLQIDYIGENKRFKV